MHLKMSSVKWCPLLPSLNVITSTITANQAHRHWYGIYIYYVILRSYCTDIFMLLYKFHSYLFFTDWIFCTEWLSHCQTILLAVHVVMDHTRVAYYPLKYSAHRGRPDGKRVRIMYVIKSNSKHINMKEPC